MNLLSVTGVSHDYPHHGRVLHAIHLAIAPGETVALLGRSGCGKSTLARMLVGLETPQHGDIAWRGTPLTALKGEAIGAFRRDIQLVFQDAFSAVNPRKTVREIVSEPLRHLLRLSREARSRRVDSRSAPYSSANRGCRPQDSKLAITGEGSLVATGTTYAVHVK